MEVKIEKLVYGGDGLAHHEGQTVFVPLVLPGELVRIAPAERKKKFVRGRLERVVEAAPERVAAPCPYFGRCGGCHYQHAPYETQLSAKSAILAEELRRVGKIEPPAEIGVIAGEPWGYRNRVQLHIEGGRLGYWETRSHKLCAIDSCPISSPKLNETIGILKGMLQEARWPR